MLYYKFKLHIQQVTFYNKYLIVFSVQTVPTNSKKEFNLFWHGNLM